MEREGARRGVRESRIKQRRYLAMVGKVCVVGNRIRTSENGKAVTNGCC